MTNTWVPWMYNCPTNPPALEETAAVEHLPPAIEDYAPAL
jgi:hypothetical protein